jgi:hypothetical protein
MLFWIALLPLLATRGAEPQVALSVATDRPDALYSVGEKVGFLVAQSVEQLPWKLNRPIVSVKKELYRKHPKPRAAAMVSVQYVGPRLELREWQAVEIRDDVADDQAARWSLDNGRTWSAWVALAPSSVAKYQGVSVWEGGGAAAFDPAAGVLVEMWLRQIAVGGVYNCFTYYRISRDFGRTWAEPKQLRYEPGDSFDPKDPLKPSFLKHNQGYPGNNVLALSDGTLVHCLAHANATKDRQNDKRPWKMGSLVFRGRWDRAAGDYEWTPGQRVETTPEVSARGLMEPEVAELKGGRLLVVWRGSNAGWDGTRAKIPGCKLFSLSADGGRTLAPPAVWTYADGTGFYSPSSFHRMIRHSVTGKLYWIGNISATPPEGNSPRYPLVIAEVDEATGRPVRSTVTAIDDRRPDQSEAIQFSNFSLVENRETHELELHLTTYGQERAPADWATADNYKYTLKIVR